MRILQIIPTIRAEGAQRMLANLAREQRAAGHEVAVASLFDPTGLTVEPELRASGVEVHTLGKRMGIDLRMMPRLARLAARFAPDVFHTHLYVLKYVVPALALRPRPVVHTVHTLAEREGTAGDDLVQRLAFRMGVAAVAIGDAVADSFERLYGVRPRRTIPNGIPVAEYAPSAVARSEVRAELGITAGAPVFVMVARLVKEKDHAAALTAFAAPALRPLSAHLLVAGDGPLRGELEEKARQLGAAERVHFLGARRDVPRVLAAADVFVLSSEFEGHPLCVMEAMAAGKPVISYAVGCVPENVSSRTGRLVAPGDVSGLAAAMRDLAADPALSRELGAEALRVAGGRFDASTMARAYDDLYQELLGAKAGSPAAPPGGSP
jgi:glycosyltransferase involved in cell wall biosynthesis